MTHCEGNHAQCINFDQILYFLTIVNNNYSLDISVVSNSAMHRLVKFLSSISSATLSIHIFLKNLSLIMFPFRSHHLFLMFPSLPSLPYLLCSLATFFSPFSLLLPSNITCLSFPHHLSLASSLCLPLMFATLPPSPTVSDLYTIVKWSEYICSMMCMLVYAALKYLFKKNCMLHMEFQI